MSGGKYEIGRVGDLQAHGGEPEQGKWRKQADSSLCRSPLIWEKTVKARCLVFARLPR